VQPDQETIRNVEKFFAATEERRTRAAERLATEAVDQLHFAIIGLRANFDSYLFDQFATLRRVIDPPNEIDLVMALKSKELFAPIGRYTQLITYELSVNKAIWPDPKSALGVAEAIINMLRIRSGAEILVPAMADHSWSTIAALKESECTATLVEDYPRVAQVELPKEVTTVHLEWVKEHVVTYVQLRSAAAFSLAVEAGATHHLSGNDRMMVAALWAGIEALFGVSQELSFRLATYIAAVLEPRGERRLQRYRATKKLYDMRSKVVHGAAVQVETIRTHIAEARALLFTLLIHVIEQGALFSTAALEEAMFA
jgi:hypothetical protein